MEGIFISMEPIASRKAYPIAHDKCYISMNLENALVCLRGKFVKNTADRERRKRLRSQTENL